MRYFVFCLVLLCSVSLSAQIKVKQTYTVINSKNLNLMAVNDTLLYSFPGGLTAPPTNLDWKGNYCFDNVVAELKLRVVKDLVCVPDTFTVYATVEVKYWTEDNTAYRDTVQLVVNYDKRAGNVYAEENGHLIEGGHFVQAKLLSVSGNLSAKAYLELGIDASGEMGICYASIQPEKRSFIKKTELVQNNEYINIEFKKDNAEEIALLGEADEFDIEWTTVDLNDGEHYMHNNSFTTPKYLCTYNFRNNATRVTVGKNVRSFKIKNIFEDDVVIFRYRRVYYYRVGGQQGIVQRITSRWSTDQTTMSTSDDGDEGTFGIPISESLVSPSYSFDEGPSIIIISGTLAHLPAFNWQYLSVFAEDAKRKEVINYFDGSLRNRQTVSSNYADNSVLVQENIYDFMGRAAIQVLPVPIVNGAFTYYSKLNRNAAGSSYSAYDFDKDIAECSAIINPMAQDSGASRYYSNNNTYKTHPIVGAAFVPVASGYPFSQTTFMPDNTGRLRKKSGLGITHQISTNGKYTEYAYETPTQNEINRLFGSEIGYAEHYKKASVIDANGQASISYTDLKGKTIATALSAAETNSLTNLVSDSIREDLEIDLIKGYTVNVSADKIIYTKRITILEPQERKFKYSFKPQDYSPPSCAISTCYDCVYDLDIRIQEVFCGTEILDGSKDTAGLQLFHRTIGFIGSADSVNEACVKAENYTTANDLDLNNSGGYLNVSLAKGTYDIVKILKVNGRGFEKYEKLYLANNVCKTLEQFEQDAYAEMDTTGCELTCEECETKFNATTGTSRAQYIALKENEFNLKGVTLTEDEKEEWGVYYDESKKRCNEICGKTNICETYLEILKNDVTPGGQYALYRINSDGSKSLVSPTIGSEPNPDYVGKNFLNTTQSYSYANLPSTLTVNIGEEVKLVKNLTLDEFITYWDDKWADELVINHPEYCEYLWCNSHSSIYNYHYEMEEVETFNDAVTADYIEVYSPIIQVDPILSLTAANDLLGIKLSTFKTFKFDVLNTPENPLDDDELPAGIYDVAMMMTFCDTTTTKESASSCLATAIDNFNNCGPYKDLYWRNYKALYLSERMQALNTVKKLSGCDVDVSTITGATQRLGDKTTEWLNNPEAIPDGPTVLGDIATDCINTCESYKEVWLDNLASCPTTLTPAMRELIITQLTIVCINGCDYTSPLGSSSVSPQNYPTASYVSFEDVFTRFPINNPDFAAAGNFYDKRFCSDLQIRFPQTYGHDYFSKSSPFADTCACSESTPPQDCPCAGGSQTSSSNTVIKLLRNDVPNAEKCSNCIDCSEYGAAFKEFYDATPGFIGTSYEDEIALQSYMNQRLGLNLTFKEYTEHAARCMGYEEVDTNRILEYIEGYVATKTTSFKELHLVAQASPQFIPASSDKFDFKYKQLDIEPSYLKPSTILYASSDNDIVFTTLMQQSVNSSLGDPNIIYDDPFYKIYSSCLCNVILNNPTYITSIQFRPALSGPTEEAIYRGRIYQRCKNFRDDYDDAFVAENEHENGYRLRYTDRVMMDYIRLQNDDPLEFDWELFENQFCSPEPGSPSPFPSYPVIPQPVEWGVLCEKTMPLFQSFYESEIKPIFEPVDGGPIQTIDLKAFLKDPEQEALVKDLIQYLNLSERYFDPNLPQEEKVDAIWAILSVCKKSACDNFLQLATAFDNEHSSELAEGVSLYQHVMDNPEEALSLQFKAMLNSTFNKPPLLIFFGQDEVDKHFKGCTQGPCKVVTDRIHDLESTHPELFDLSNAQTLVQKLRKPTQASLVNDLLDDVNALLIRAPYFKKLTKATLLANIEACWNCTNVGTSLNLTKIDSVVTILSTRLQDSNILRTTWLTSLPWNIAANTPPIIRNALSKHLYKDVLTYCVKEIDYHQSFYHAEAMLKIGLPFYLKLQTVNYSSSSTDPWNYIMALPASDFSFYKINGMDIVHVTRLTSTEVELLVRLEYKPNAVATNRYQYALMVLPSYPFYSDLIANQSCRKNFELCNRPIQEYTLTIAEDPCITRLKIAAKYNAQIAYKAYVDNLRDAFRSSYISECLKIESLEESLKMKYTERIFHYTLYYYDQAGNLVKTVPPAGVVPLDESQQAAIDAERIAGATTIIPAHFKRTHYTYNTLNQLVWQNTPDAGASYFYYDKVGRLVLSHNAKQVTDNKYSYTEYDEQGRITAVGEIQKTTAALPPALTTTMLNPSSASSWLSSGTRTQITRTRYDEPFNLSLVSQTNLRGRVSISTFQYADNPLPDKFDFATYYSYDVQGNVHKLVRQNKSLEDIDQDMKQVDYDFDLISGKVNRVVYQQGYQDQYIHEYKYDSENRIIKVYTGNTDYHLEEDAEYYYYLHGPLARTELGTHQVQGVDYAYTVNGWLKGVNSETLKADRDMGRDGNNVVNEPNRYSAQDVFGFMLGYYAGDYAPVGGSSAQVFMANLSGSTLNGTAGNLYNGNIRMMTTAISKFMSSGASPLATAYGYDQLNRIQNANYFNNLDVSGNAWQTTAGIADYYNHFVYDADGNITLQIRRGNNLKGLGYGMDSLSYHYDSGNNRLRYITDPIAGNAYDDDVETQQANNYTYDAIGNLISDKAEEIDTIEWNVYGKITKITRKAGSAKPNLEFAYSPDGHRIMKLVIPTQLNQLRTYTYYMRDAQGNIMATYSRKFEKVINYDSIEYAKLNDSIISKSSIDVFSTFIGTLHSGQLVNTAFTNYLDNLLDDTVSFQTNFLYANSPVSMLTSDSVLLDSLVMRYDSLSMIKAIMETGLEAGGAQIATKICNCMASKPVPFFEWSIQDVTAREHLLRSMYTFNVTDFNAVMTALSCPTTPLNTAISCMLSKSVTSVRSALNARGYSVSCSSKFPSLYGVMNASNKPNFEKIIARVPEFKKMVARIGGYSCMTYTHASLATTLYSNTTYTWDRLMLIKTRSYLVTWYKQNNLPAFIGTITKQKKTWVSGYQQTNNMYSTSGNGIQTYLNYVKASYSQSFMDNLLMPFYNASNTYIDTFRLSEWVLYGSARLGTQKANKTLVAIKVSGAVSKGEIINKKLLGEPWDNSEGVLTDYTINRGNKRYELSNHLGNVLAVISDKKIPVCVSNVLSYFAAELHSATDYSPFGAPLTARNWNLSDEIAKTAIATQAFASGIDSWTTAQSSTTLSNSSGRLLLSTTNTGAVQGKKTYTTLTGKKYRIQLDVDAGSLTGATLSILGYNNIVLSSTPINGSCFQQADIIANGLSITISVNIPSGTGTRVVYIDNVKLEEIKGDVSGYRFGFNGQEKDDEVIGAGNSYDFEARMYNPRLGRWMSIDPLACKYPYLSPYNFVANSPLSFVDHDGEKIVPAENLTTAEKTRVESGIQLVDVNNNELYTYLNELKYLPGQGYLSKGDDGYDNPDAFEVIIEVGVKELDGKSYVDEVMAPKTFSENSEDQGEATFGDVGYQGVTGGGENAWFKSNDADAQYGVKSKKITEQNKDDENTVILVPQNNGKPHYKIDIDDYLPSPKSDGSVLAHEMGHIKGFIKNALNTYFFDKIFKGDKKDGHADGNASGNTATDEQIKFNKNADD